MIEPLRIEFDVACSPDHAFETWTRKATYWWPPEHTVSHERGEVVQWDPPQRLRYRWRIATDPENATEVEIVFRRLGDSKTRVEVEHGGWDRLGDISQRWRDANQAGWDGVLPAYAEAART